MNKSCNLGGFLTLNETDGESQAISRSYIMSPNWYCLRHLKVQPLSSSASGTILICLILGSFDVPDVTVVT